MTTETDSDDSRVCDPVAKDVINNVTDKVLRAANRVASERIKKIAPAKRSRKKEKIIKDWNELIKMFPRQGFRDVVSRYNDNIFEIENLARIDLKGARHLANKMEFIEYHQYVFDDQLDITENDFAIKLWGPFLEKVYRATNLSPGFKVDLRIVKDTLARRKKEADKGNVELARKDCSLSKTCSDRTKLLIESKCVLDRLNDEHSHLDVKDIKVPALQLLGAKARMHTLRVVGVGMYVGIKEKGATVPSKADDITEFRPVKLTLNLVECTLAKNNNDDSDDESDGSDTSDNDTNKNDSDSSDEGEWTRDT
ncbi:hypothetical protein BDC45DRAFT_567303 [Circinella umbellata]|nr:hypothetical protein BDC45DRAFT_567303 [Circinella umbellata]